MSSFQDIFISYGRIDSKAFAAKLNQRFLSVGLDSWFDMEDIPLGVDYQKQIDQSIERTHNFLFVISPHSVNSPYCSKELDLAVKYRKQIIPILHVEEISYESWQARYPQGTETDWLEYRAAGLHSSYTNMRPELARINWSFFREGIDDFEKSFADLLDHFQRHQPYVEQHTHLLNQALLWQRERRHPQYLLLGEDRLEAERWLKYPIEEVNLSCAPTDLHCEFITESTKNAQNLMTQVFLANSDEDQAIAHEVRRYLNRHGITVWTAQRDVKSGTDFHTAIQQGIEEADNVVYLLSPDSVKSAYCQQEIAVAQLYHKRIIPLLIAPVPPSDLPTTLHHLQHIDTTHPPGSVIFEQSIGRLLNTLEQDADYHATHKNLLVKALKWERQHRNASILLRGHNLRYAEAWLSIARTKDKLPVPLQVLFIEESRRQPPDLAPDVFISYSRADADFARRLNDSLQVHGKVTWFDQESISSGTDFQQEIYQGIQICDNFLFVLSPQAVTSPYCADEVEYAVGLGKRIIPVLYRSVEPGTLPPGLAKIQWIDFNRGGYGFHTYVGELIRTLDTDRDHVRGHTRWARRALEWQQAGHSDDLLLRGNEFVLADDWLQTAIRGAKTPAPLPLHHDFIEASQVAIQAEQARERRQTNMLRSLLTIVATAYSQAEAQHRRAEIVQEGQIHALSRYSQALLASHQNLEARVESLRAGRQLQQQMQRVTVSETLKTQVVNALRSTLREGAEFNQLAGHSQPITDIAVSPDGQAIATASLDGTVRLWTPQGEEQRTLDGHHDSVYGVCFSPDGTQVATAGADATIRLWSAKTGDPGAVLAEHTDWVYRVRYRPDGQQLASCSVDGTVILWSLDGTPLEVLRHPDTVIDVCFSPDGSRLATACVDQVVRVWDSAGQLLFAWSGHNAPVTAIHFSPQGDALVSGSVDGTLRLWDLSSGTSTVLEGHQDAVWGVRFSADGQTLISASSDKSLKFWERSSHILLTLRGHQDTVSALALHPTDPIVVSGSYDKTVRLWRYGLPQVQIISADAAGVNDVALLDGGQDRQRHDRASVDEAGLAIAPSASGTSEACLESAVMVRPVPTSPSLLAIAGVGGTVHLWTTAGEKSRSWLAHDDAIKGIATAPTGNRFATASVDRTVKLWDPQGQLLATLNGHQLPVRRVAFSPDGSWLATASYDKTTRLWTVAGEPLGTLAGHTDQVWDVAFSPVSVGEGVLLATAGWDKTVCLWQLTLDSCRQAPQTLDIDERGRSPWRTLTGHQDGVSSLCFSPTGEYIASASQDRTVRIWSLDGQQRACLEHDQSVMAVCFSPDDRWVATAGYDRHITVWSRAGQRLQTLTGHTNTIWRLQFWDANTLMSASEDGTVRLWSLDSDRLEATAQLQDLSLDNLLNRACDDVRDYLRHNANLTDSDRSLCQSS